MSMARSFKGVMFACLFWCGQAFAVVAVPGLTTVNGTAAPGGTAVVEFNGYAGGFDLASIDFTLTYDSSHLTFLPLHSNVVINGLSHPLAAGLALLFPDSVESTASSGVLSVTAYSLGSTLIDSLVFRPAFTLSGSAVPGQSYAVAVQGYAGSAGNDLLPFSAAAAVTAVPEPAEWLMLLSGVLIAAAAARRRRD